MSMKNDQEVDFVNKVLVDQLHCYWHLKYNIIFKSINQVNCITAY